MMQQNYQRSATLASGRASRGQQWAAMATVLVAVAATVALMPVAERPGPVMPGFFVVHQTALIMAYGLGAWMLYAQFLRSRALSLLIAAGGTLFTTAIVLLQLLSIPGVFAPGRLLGDSSATTTWLWTAWHLGPPIWGLAIGWIVVGGGDWLVPARFRAAAAAGMAALALVLAGSCAVVATLLLPWLPLQVVGDDYSAVLTSGIGPGLGLLTIEALGAMIWATRGRRSTLDVWIIASLALLVLDTALTLAGGTRGSVGWTAGRVLALASAGAVIWAYLHEVERLRYRAETALEELAATEEKLHVAKKMEAVGQLTGGIAHDFNNLLMVVTSSFDMIRRVPDDPARVSKIAEAGLLAAERGARLNRQLLTFASRQALRPEIVDPNSALQSFEASARRVAGGAAEFIWALGPTTHPVRMDPAEFESAIVNLISNAREVLSVSGRITVTSHTRLLLDPQAGGGLLPGEYTVVAVADNGPGMTAEIASRAFEPFFTTKDFGSGAGLGLSQVYGFARAAGGEAVIRTQLGHGTTVELWLPRAGSQEAANQAPANTTPLRRARDGEIVLAVEDEPEVLAVVVENLADLGYQVLAARNAAEALELLRGAAQVDLLFSDVVMPGGMNGVQLATEATRLRPDIRVLLTSGYTNQALETDQALPPNLDILPKPYRRAELATRLKLVMRAA